MSTTNPFTKDIDDVMIFIIVVISVLITWIFEPWLTPSSAKTTGVISQNTSSTKVKSSSTTVKTKTTKKNVNGTTESKSPTTRKNSSEAKSKRTPSTATSRKTRKVSSGTSGTRAKNAQDVSQMKTDSATQIKLQDGIKSLPMTQLDATLPRKSQSSSQIALTTSMSPTTRTRGSGFSKSVKAS